MTLKTPDDESCLATLIHLSKRARHSTNLAELRFILVNETKSLLPYRQSAYFSIQKGVETVSGVATLDQQSPYIQWLNNWFRQLNHDNPKAFTVNLESLSGKGNIKWSDWLPKHLSIIPLGRKDQYEGGFLLLARETPFTQEEVTILQEWSDAWQHAYQQILPKRLSGKLTNLLPDNIKHPFATKSMLALLLLLICFIPVKLTVLGPAELIPLKPSVIRAPIDGIIDEIFVKPNQRVSEGTPLFEFERLTLSNRLEVARKELSTIKTEYRQSAQNALFNADSKSKLSLLKSQVEEKQVEISYLETLYERSIVSATQDGIIILNDITEWIGKPVISGERVLIIADEKQVQIEVWLSPADMIKLDNNSEVTLYLSADPLTPVKAKLNYISHQANLRVDNTYGYRLRASLTDKNITPRIGLKGTARIEGESVTLIYWILRRPIASLRGWIGL